MKVNKSIFVVLLFFIIPSIVFAQASFIITSVNVVLEKNMDSKIEIDIVNYNKSDIISPWIPKILPSGKTFTITDMFIESKNAALFGANFLKDGVRQPDVLIPSEIDVTEFTFLCHGCIEKLSDEPFDKYLFLFPFSVRINNQAVNGIIMDSIVVKIPDAYQLAVVGKDSVIGGGLVKVSTNSSYLPENLDINNIPANTFGLKINGEKVTRLSFDPVAHLLLIEYEKPLLHNLVVLFSPIVVLILYILSFILNIKWKKEISILGFVSALVFVRLFFISDLRLVIWDIELTIIAIVGVYLFYLYRKKTTKR